MFDLFFTLLYSRPGRNAVIDDQYFFVSPGIKELSSFSGFVDMTIDK